MQKEYLFIYGSLKKGFPNHNRIQKDEIEFIGNATTVEKYAMFKDGFGNFPYMTTNAEINRIDGEVYLIKDSSILEDLDKFEGHPKYFERIEIKVYLYNEDEKIRKAFDIIDAYVYINNNNKIIRPENSLTKWEK